MLLQQKIVSPVITTVILFAWAKAIRKHSQLALIRYRTSTHGAHGLARREPWVRRLWLITASDHMDRIRPHRICTQHTTHRDSFAPQKCLRSKHTNTVSQSPCDRVEPRSGQLFWKLALACTPEPVRPMRRVLTLTDPWGRQFRGLVLISRLMRSSIFRRSPIWSNAVINHTGIRSLRVWTQQRVTRRQHV